MNSKVSPMESQVPAIEELTRQLSECPQIFLDEPRQHNGSGVVSVAAVVSDLMRNLGIGPLKAAQVEAFAYSSQSQVSKERNRLRLILIACWLGTHACFLGAGRAQKLLLWLSSGLDELAKLVNADKFVSEGERREELARLALSAISLVPLGEGEKEAENKLDSVSTVKRTAVVKQAQAAELRARKLREELAAKERARQAASVYGHE